VKPFSFKRRPKDTTAPARESLGMVEVDMSVESKLINT
jgi:hypothetical protein